MSPVTAPAPPEIEACVWMTAGLLSYRLCDREFDCEHCPLDAALRGRMAAVAPAPDREPSSAGPPEPFPSDRVYSIGHTWLQSARDDGTRLRFGLDRFAASLICTPRRILWRSSSDWLRRGATVCELDLDHGRVSLTTPVVARIGTRNPLLASEPGAVATAPYGSGWILELEPGRCDDLDGLLSSHEAVKQATHDVRHLVRRVAHHLLARIGAGDFASSTETIPPTGLHQLLGSPQYLEMVREFVS